MSLIDDIRKALQGEKKSDFIDQLLKEQGFYEALHKAGLTVTAADPTERGRLQPFGVLSKVQKIDLVDLISVITLIQTIQEIIKIDEITIIKAILSLPDITVKGSEGGAFKQAPISTGYWVSPDGFDDPSDVWTDEPSAYDNNDSTFAQTLVPSYPALGGWLYLTFSTPILCNMLEILTLDTAGVQFEIDVYRDGEWVTVWYGQTSGNNPPYYQWGFGTGTVSQVRIRFWMPSGSGQYVGVCELKLWKLGEVGGELFTIEAEKGTVIPFSKTATADLYTPATGKHVKVWGGFYYSQADIITELRFKSSGKVVLALPTLGSVGMELKRTEMIGATNEVLEIYLGGAGTVKGWVCVSDE